MKCQSKLHLSEPQIRLGLYKAHHDLYVRWID
jgi:hypothetical protein